MDATTLSLQQRLERVSTQIHQLDPDHHSALLFSLLGTIEGVAQFNPQRIETIVHLLEQVMNDMAAFADR